MRILHALSQRPEATGSGIYVRAMVREAFHAGHENFLLAGIPADDRPRLDCLTGDQCAFVHFETGSLPFPVVGMSDVMPYPSRRFSDLTAADLDGDFSALLSPDFTFLLRRTGPGPAGGPGLRLPVGPRPTSPASRRCWGICPGPIAGLVELPRLKSLDTPFPDDEASFEECLAAAIRDQIEAVRQEPKMDPALTGPHPGKILLDPGVRSGVE